MKETDVRENNNIEGGKHLIDYSQGVVSYFNMVSLQPLFQGVLPLFGKNVESFNAAAEKLTTDLSVIMADRKNNTDKKIGRGQGRKWDYTFKNQEDIELLMNDADKMVEILDKTIESYAENSYPRRILSALKKQMEFTFSPEYLDIQRNDQHLDAFVNHFNDFPVPEFVKGYDENNNPIFETNFEKYDEFMRKHEDFLLQFEDRQNFLFETYVPYMSKKKAGAVTEHDEKMFKKKYYEHLKREQIYWNKFKYDYKWSELKDIAPFAINENQYFMDWKGERGADPALRWINQEMRYLENGWSPEDIPFLQDIERMHRDIALPDNKDDKKEPANDEWAKDREKFNKLYEKFNNTQVTSGKVRKEMIASMKPYVEKYNSMLDNVNTDGTLRGIDTAVNNEVRIINLTEEERVRQEMLKSLTDIRKRLDIGRMGVNHASKEMQQLRKNLDKAIKRFKDRTVGLDSILGTKKKGIQYNPYMRVLEEVAKSAKNYRDIKRKDAKAAPNDKKWKPKTEMGIERYDAAGELEKVCGKFMISIVEMADKSELSRRMSDKKGFKVTYKDDLEYMYKDVRPYEKDLVFALNYFGKKPDFIPEHCAKTGKTFTLEQFERQCKPYDLPDVSNDEFALVAFAAIYDYRNLSPEYFEKYKARNVEDTTKNLSDHDIAKGRRPMYIEDYFKAQPRASIGEKFNDYTLVPAREKAFNVLKDYKTTGNLDGLADVLAEGIKELNRECVECAHISGPDSTGFAIKTEMLKRMVEYMEKKPALYEKVAAKIGLEGLEETRDYLRLKGYMDKSIDAEKRLEDAVKNNKPLSTEEKAECIRDIVKYELLENVRTNALEEIALENKQLQDFLSKMEQMYKDSARKKNDLTAAEIGDYRNAMELNARKPVYKVTKALRTKEGLEELDNCVDKMVGKLSMDKPINQLLADVKAFKNDLKYNTVAAKNNAAKRTESSKKRQEEVGRPRRNAVTNKGPKK